jgi:Tol biopolymer transport system component
VDTTVSPDGSTLASFIWDVETDIHWDIELVSLTGEPERRLFTPSPRNEMHPEFSPDGNWIAYTSGHGDSSEIYVKAFPERGAAIQVSRGGGSRAFWDPDGDALFFLGENDTVLMRTEFTTGATPRRVLQSG